MRKNTNVLVITGVNIVDVLKKNVHENNTIICVDGRIKSISPVDSANMPENAEILNLPGRYILPGLIDAHVHLALSSVDDMGKITTESMTKRYLRNSLLTIQSGVTTVRNMPGRFGSSIFKFREKVNAGKYIGPRILASGQALVPSYGYFSIKGYIPAPAIIRKILSIIFGAHGLSIDVDAPEEVRKAVSKLKNAGVDFIKTTTPGSAFDIMPEIRESLRGKVDPRILDAGMKPEVLEAIVKCAHNEGLKVAAHTMALPEHIKQGVNAGLDSIEHTPFGIVDAETWEQMREAGVCWVPTGFIFINVARLIKNPDLFNSCEYKKAVPEPYHSIGLGVLKKKRQAIQSGADPIWAKLYNEIAPRYEEEYFPVNFENAIKAGVKIIAGTDAGAGGAGWFPHGFFYKEIELFAKHGMNMYDVIQTATINAAELLGVADELGSIDNGKFADFVILNENPLNDISTMLRITHVIKNGIFIPI